MAAGLAALFLLAFARSGLEAPPPTRIVRDRHGRFLGEVGGEGVDGRAGFWALPELPPRVVAATLAAEDRRFWRHPGVDPLAVGRALRQNLGAGRRLSGASTLAMQVARLQHPGRRTYLRKVVEGLTALVMTARHGREAVLAHYLRIVPYGNRVHGIAHAARRYLDKPVEDLSWAETAFLTAIPQSPTRHNPFHPEGRERAVRRGRAILDRLREEGVLGAAEHELASRQIGDLVVPPPGERPWSTLHALLRTEEMLGEAPPAVTRRGVVDTTLDLETQDQVAWITRQAREAWEAQGAGNAAVVVVDREANEVRAWVGSADYFDDRFAGAIDYARVPRSPGSALKPFLYAHALDRGVVTPATVLDDLERGPGGIVNADEQFLGPLLPRFALANSRNVPAALLVTRLGTDAAYDFLGDLGLHDRSVPGHRYGAGLAIGGLPVTLEALVRAYSALASEGRLRDLVWFREAPRERGRLVLSEESARQVTLFLSDPMARLPSFPRMGRVEYPFPVAVKTGTSSRFRDAWTVAYSARYLVGVWVGHPDLRPMNGLTGPRAAGELAQRVLLTLQPDEAQGLSDVGFPPPRGSRPVRLCALTGLLATEACDRVVAEWLRPEEVPVDECRAHVRLVVDRRTGRPAGPGTPREEAELRTFVDLPPRYAAWAAAAGLPRLPWAAGPLGLTVPGGAPPTALLATARAGEPVRVGISSPENGLRILRDPETPAAQATLALRAVVDPPVPQVVWYVDGRPFEVADYPYTARWPLQAGDHVFQARLPSVDAASARVSVAVE